MALSKLLMNPCLFSTYISDLSADSFCHLLEYGDGVVLCQMVSGKDDFRNFSSNLTTFELA